MKFGDDWSWSSQINSNSLIFYFGLNIIFKGLFERFLGVGGPQVGSDEILTPKDTSINGMMSFYA